MLEFDIIIFRTNKKGHPFTGHKCNSPHSLVFDLSSSHFKILRFLHKRGAFDFIPPSYRLKFCYHLFSCQNEHKLLLIIESVRIPVCRVGVQTYVREYDLLYFYFFHASKSDCGQIFLGNWGPHRIE